MDKIHDSVAWYQKKIGFHDKQLWEHSVDRKVLTGIRNAPRRSVRAKTDLIDVDLIRGSTFTRAKPQVSWTYIVHKAISRVIFFPFHYKWWLQQTTPAFFGCLLVLYTAQVLTTIFFCQNVGAMIQQDEVTLSEVFLPISLMFLLGYIHSSTVVSQSHVSHRSHRDIKSMREYQARKKRSEERKRTASSSPTHSGDKSVTDIDRKSPNNDRRVKRTVKNKEHGMKMRKNNGMGSKSVSWSDAFHDDAISNEWHESEGSSDDEQTGSSSRGDKSGPVMKGLVAEMMPGDSCTKEYIKNRTEKWSKERNKNKLNLDIPSSSEMSTSSTGTPFQSLEQGTFTMRQQCARVDVLSSDMTVTNRNETDSIDGLIIPNSIDGTIFHVQNMTASEANQFDIKPKIENIHVLGNTETGACFNPDIGSGSAFERVPTGCINEIENQLLENAVESRSMPPEVLKRAESSDRGSESSSVDRGNEQFNTVRQGENLSEDSGIDFTNRGLLARSRSLPAHPVSITPLKEPVSDSDQEHNGTVSESEKESQLKANSAVLQGLRRRSQSLMDESSEMGTSYRLKRSLLRNKQDTFKQDSSSEGEMSQASSQKAMTISSEEWDDRVQSDDTTSTYSSTSASDVDIGNGGDQETLTTNSSSANHMSGDIHVINLLQPNTPDIMPTSSSGLGHHYVPPDKVSCVIWEKGECQKVELTALELGWTIIEKVDNIPESGDYIWIGLGFSIVLSLAPVLFRIYHVKELPPLDFVNILSRIWCFIMHNPWRINLIMVNGIFQRFCLSSIFFFLLSVADRTFKQRLLYAKHFCYLTSSRRAKKFDMPHFRLNKVRNIRIWLSVRSYLKKRGPQRSVDVIVSSSFLITIVTITLMCLQLLKDTDSYLDYLYNWELLLWSMTLGVYLFRFLTLGLKINKKYRNLSVLITEQINLYLQMEQKPHKKEELMVANNVLKLAEDLLKELESPFKVSGITANPVIYNITRVVVLSAFSAVLTELLGFKLKLYKIKLKA